MTAVTLDIEDLKVGEKLPNGSTLLAVLPAGYPERWTVLALTPVEMSNDRYAVWEARRTGECYDGSYHQYLMTALEEFDERT